MTVTATETDWLSPELQMAAVAALQILKAPGSDEHRNTLLGIVGFHQGKERGKGDVCVDTRRHLITDSPGEDCVRIGRLAYKMSKQHDVEAGHGQIWRTAMMQLDDSPIRSRKAFVGDTYSSGSHIYPEDWDCIRHSHIILATLLNNAVRDVLWDLHDQLPL